MHRSYQYNEENKSLVLRFFLSFFFLFQINSKAQFPGLFDAIAGQNSLLRGVKNVVGGVLAVDNVHSQCIQKTVCDEMAEEIVENSVELDPVKRTWVYKPKVIKKRGRLRWIGDLIVNGLSRAARRIGFVPNSNRRQSGGFMGNMATIAMTGFHKIPRDAMIQ